MRFWLGIIGAFVCGFAACALLLWTFANLRDGPRRELEAGFQAITYQMARSDVTRLMKSPGTVSAFHLGQIAGFEWEYAAAAHSGAAYFVSWEKMDWVFTVGFDSADRAIFKAAGGT